MKSITLSVVSFNGQPVDDALAAHFDELGGLIGRADTNQLVLPDPERTISRVHAQIVFRGQRYAIVDRGSNPILVNGQPAGTDREIMLKDGDRVQIGGYEIEVSQGGGSSAAPADPFADLFGASAAPAGAARRPAPIDPLERFASSAAAAPPLPAAPPPSLSTGIPTDWDPFAPDPAPAPAGRSAGPSSSLGLDLGAAAPAALIPGLAAPARADSLDALFGLGGGSVGGDPFAESALGQPSALPNMAADADPLKSLGRAPQATAPTLPDDLSDLHRPFVPARAAPPPPPPPSPSPSPKVSAAVMSWDADVGEGHTVIRRSTPRESPSAPATPSSPPPATGSAMPPGMASPAAAPAAPLERAVGEPSVASFAPPVAPPAANPLVPPPRQPAGVDVQALTDALRDGLAVPELRLDALTPELMRLVGGLLREAAAGTVDLLLARSAFKNEMRADQTMIATRENNPLKFSPTVDVALQHLLSPPARGFLAAAPAMRDAYADLRAHQYGMVAGMRAALDGVLDRFDPAQLEGQLTQRSMLDSLIPGSRKARLWEVFVEHFDRIRDEAADDFQTLFGRAFLAAYEQHLDQTDREPGA